MTAPDLAALERVDAWAHFGADQAEALDALRAAMGDSYTDAPEDAELLAALELAVAYLEGATGRVFVPRSGELLIDGTGSPRLFLPLPVVSASQLEGAGVSEVSIGGEVLDADGYVVADGVGLPGRDPRDHPWIDLHPGPVGGSFVSRPPGWEGWRVWPWGPRVVSVTAVWGYLDERGQTPALARQALAGLTVRALVRWDDPDARADLTASAVVSEATRDRSISYSARVQGGGITTDRELDLLIARLRAPRPPRVPRAPGRRARPWRDSLLGPVRGSS